MIILPAARGLFAWLDLLRSLANIESILSPEDAFVHVGRSLVDSMSSALIHTLLCIVNKSTPLVDKKTIGTLTPEEHHPLALLRVTPAAHLPQIKLQVMWKAGER